MLYEVITAWTLLLPVYSPKAADHQTLPPLASRFVDPAGIPWEDTRFPGVRQKVLVVDRDTGVATVLIHMASYNFV